MKGGKGLSRAPLTSSGLGRQRRERRRSLHAAHAKSGSAPQGRTGLACPPPPIRHLTVGPQPSRAFPCSSRQGL
ncbi:hypothetical protein NDU88_001513 [Pleurodeles waltl]|uniref:Uncharacterized protein n=1 Tax=Pleurodeles waltl TaxID=8319 RepID=A0AAV7SA38_PLEWA|nr:hypothetical protein NDU88_001513 [Pleurodeles waltl]